MHTRSLLAFFLTALLAACGGSVGGGGTGAGGGSPDAGTGGTGGTGGGSPDAGPDADACGAIGCVNCSTSGTPMFPTFDKTCASDADCALEFHQISCCGTRIAIGVRASVSAAFDAAEAACESMYPACGCAQQPTKAEDGKEGPENTMQVACTMGACSSFVP
jgi:hypothetical protein